MYHLYASVYLAHYELVRAKVCKGGIDSTMSVCCYIKRRSLYHNAIVCNIHKMNNKSDIYSIPCDPLCFAGLHVISPQHPMTVSGGGGGGK